MSACGCTHHLGETHEEYMDRFDREENERNRDRAVELLRSAKTYGEAVHARALLHSAASAEIRRLREKERLMKAGLIRERKA